jgi:hypothetical protein
LRRKSGKGGKRVSRKNRPPANGVVVMSWVKRKVLPLRTRRRHVSDLPRVTTTTIGAVNALGAERERERESERDREKVEPAGDGDYVCFHLFLSYGGVWSSTGWVTWKLNPDPNFDDNWCVIHCDDLKLS